MLLSVLYKLICVFKVVPMENPNRNICRNEQTDSKIHMEMQGPQNSQKYLKEEQRWRIKTQFKIYNKVKEAN
jgi:hypothetical protein